MKEIKIDLLWNVYKIKNQFELAEIFHLTYWKDIMSHELHWNILMQLDCYLLDLINSYDWLLACLKYLDKDNYLLFLLKIWDKLVYLLKDTTHLTEVLSKIPWNSNKILLLKKLRFKWLSSIIKDARDLWNILEFLYTNAQKQFLDILWKDFIKLLFSKTNQIIIILNYLTDENKEYIMSMIWIDWTKKKVKTYKDLLIIFRRFTDNLALEYLKLYDKKELLIFFSSQDEFNYFLLKLSQNRANLFLDFINWKYE